MYSSAKLQDETTNKVETRYKTKAALATDKPAPNNESINLKGGTKSTLRNSETILLSKNSPNVAPSKIASNAKPTYWSSLCQVDK